MGLHRRASVPRAARRMQTLLAACAFVLGWSLAVPSPSRAQLLSVEETEDLVRAVYFEGMPEEAAAAIGPEGCERLIEMLGDPGERASHGQIMVAIGICGPAGGFEAVSAWADAEREGEVDRDTFRAWQALPFALGHLARHDRRALDRLELGLNAAEAPSWTFRHHRGARLVSLSRRAAASSLAMTGLPEAASVLERAHGRSSDQDFEAHLSRARAMHRQAADARARAGQGPADRNQRGGLGERR